MSENNFILEIQSLVLSNSTGDMEDVVAVGYSQSSGDLRVVLFKSNEEVIEQNSENSLLFEQILNILSQNPDFLAIGDGAIVINREENATQTDGEITTSSSTTSTRGRKKKYLH
jgi:hypothetical protein